MFFGRTFGCLGKVFHATKKFEIPETGKVGVGGNCVFFLAAVIILR
jgi:hypothetical protein